jgi:hypothetical protein
MTYRSSGATFTRETVEYALDLHQREGRIRSWRNWHEDKPGRRRPMYTVHLSGGHFLDLATVHEAHAFLAGLTSANDAHAKEGRS